MMYSSLERFLLSSKYGVKCFYADAKSNPEWLQECLDLELHSMDTSHLDNISPKETQALTEAAHTQGPFVLASAVIRKARSVGVTNPENST